MAQDHDYNVATEVVVDTDQLTDIKNSIAELTSTVKYLLDKQNEPIVQERPANNANYRKRRYPEEDEISVHVGSNASCDASEQAKSQRTSLSAEESSQNHQPKHTSQSAVRACTSTDLNDLFQKDKSTRKTSNADNIQLEEEILCAVEQEQAPVAPLQEGEPILQNLADRVHKYWETNPQNAKSLHLVINKLCETYRTPSNCDRLKTPLINEAIYKSLSPAAKRHDADLAEIQKHLMVATNASIQIAQSVLEADNKSIMVDSKVLIKHILNTLTVLGAAHGKLNNRRKSGIAPYLDANLRDICNPKHPVTGYLFGDDLPKAIKDAKEVSRLSASIKASDKKSYYKDSTPHREKYSYGQKSAGQNKRFFQKARKTPFKEKRSYRK